MTWRRELSAGDREKIMLNNQLLDTTAMSGSAGLQGSLKPIEFAHGDVLAEPTMPIERIVFPSSGLLSILVDLEEGDRIEVGMIGSRGALGGGALFGAKCHLHRAIAQVSGRGWSMPLENAKELAQTSPEFAQLLFAQEQYLLAQARQFTACNAKHLISQRLCSWLLRAQDEIGGNELLMTQEMLAKMLGVQRASVSMFASQLQENGLIGYRRGRLRVADPEGLAAAACGCHNALKKQHAKLFPEHMDGLLAVRGQAISIERPEPHSTN